MSVYCVEYRQEAVESRYGVSSIAEGNPSSTYWMETWISTRRDFQANFVFQDDNGPAHRGRRVMDFIEDDNVQHMDWPAMSPDLNRSRTSGLKSHVD